MANKGSLRTFFQIISLFGTLFFYIPVTAYLLKINSKLAINLIFILIFTEIISAAIKYIYPKQRPIPMPNKTFVQKYFAGSFPSVHTARITAFSIAIAASNKIFMLTALLIITAVGYSRIYLKKHYFIDVLAGFIIGALISILWLGIQNYLNLY